MTPELTLAAIASLQGARVIEELSGGPASHSYLVARDSEKFVLRIDTKVAALLGLDRFSEAKILACISTHGLGPYPEFVDVKRGVLVTQYIEGRVWAEADLHQHDQLRKLANLLRTLHSLAPVGPAFNLHDKIGHYAQLIGSSEARELADESQRFLRILQESATKSCLCHNDLVWSNIVEGRELSLIDWEYAAMGDPFFDLATVTEHHQLDEAESAVFLAAYFGRQPAVEVERLAHYRDLYANLKWLWLESVG